MTEVNRNLADRLRSVGLDRLAYTDAKSAFILDALEAAGEWAAQAGWGLPPERRIDR